MKARFQMFEREERLQGPDLVRLDIPDGTDDIRQITNKSAFLDISHGQIR